MVEKEQHHNTATPSHAPSDTQQMNAESACTNNNETPQIPSDDSPHPPQKDLSQPHQEPVLNGYWGQVKSNLHAYTQQGLKHTAYLKQLFQKDPKTAVFWWFKTFREQDALKASIHELVHASKKDDFTLNQVSQTLSSYTFTEDVKGQIQWFADAHNKVMTATQQLEAASTIKKSILTPILNEFKYIINAEELWHDLGLSSIHLQVNTMYQKLFSLLEDLKKIESDKLTSQKEQQALDKEKLKQEEHHAQVELEKLAAIKEKEKRLSIVEQKKAQIAKKEADVIEIQRQEKEAELNAQAAEKQRQLQLQNSYVELQIQEKLDTLSIPELSIMLSKKLSKDADLSDADHRTLDNLRKTLEECK